MRDGVSIEATATYQAHAQEEDLKEPPHQRGAGDVAVAHGRHGDHQKVDALPVSQLVDIAKVWEVAAVFKLEKRDSWK